MSLNPHAYLHFSFFPRFPGLSIFSGVKREKRKFFEECVFFSLFQVEYIYKYRIKIMYRNVIAWMYGHFFVRELLEGGTNDTNFHSREINARE